MIIFALLTRFVLPVYAMMPLNDQIDVMRRKALFPVNGTPPLARSLVDTTEAEKLLWIEARGTTLPENLSSALRALAETYRIGLHVGVSRRADIRSAEHRVQALMNGAVDEELATLAPDELESRVHDLLTIERALAKQTDIARPDLHEALELVAAPDQIMARAAKGRLRIFHRTNVYRDEIQDFVDEYLARTSPRRALQIKWAWETLDDQLMMHVLDATGMDLGLPDRPFRVRPVNFGREDVMAMTTEMGKVGEFIGKLIGAIWEVRNVKAELGRLAESRLRTRAIAVIDHFEDLVVEQIHNLRIDVQTAASEGGTKIVLSEEQWRVVEDLAECSRALVLAPPN
jgi:hypothetical protein